MESTSPAAVAGYPHITVPAGYILGLPIGISFIARAWQEQDAASLLTATDVVELAKSSAVFPQHFLQPSEADSHLGEGAEVPLPHLAKVAGHKNLQMILNVYYRETMEDVAKLLD
jgi:hypothetical protein